MATFTVVMDTTHIDEVRQSVRKHEQQGWNLVHTEGRWFEHTFFDEVGYKEAVGEFRQKRYPTQAIPLTLKSEFLDKAPAYTGFLIFKEVNDGPAQDV